MVSLERVAFEPLLPHTGTMCLLDRVLAWDDRHIRCRAASHRNPGHPLAEAGRLHAVCGVEYAAQAAALHAGLMAPANRDEAATAGYLAGIRHLSLARLRLDDLADDLIIAAERQLADRGGLVYDFRIAAGAHPVLAGRLSILFPKI